MGDLFNWGSEVLHLKSRTKLKNIKPRLFPNKNIETVEVAPHVEDEVTVAQAVDRLHLVAVLIIHHLIKRKRFDVDLPKDNN